MLRRNLVVALTALAVTLGGCDIGVRADASKAIERFLTAVHDDDRKAFEAAIDRAALRADLRDQLTDLARAKGVVVEGGPSEFALDRMINPAAFRLVEARTGQALPAAPKVAAIALMMHVRDRSHVCVGDPGKPRCLLSFAKRDGTWRLVGMQATDLKIEVPPVPAKKSGPAKK
jgi:hypothetical protein